MSSVNKTENYGLSQFSANDQPTWMGDYSGDMQKIDTALGNSVKRTSDKFSESLPYAAGAYCIKDDLLYKFKSAKSAGAWDASKVQATTVMSEITGLTEKNEYPVTSGYPIMLNDVTMMGNNVNANIGIRKNDGFPNTYTEIATLNNKTFPKTVIRFPCIVTSTSDGSIIGYGEVKIDTNGKIYVRSSVNENYSEIYFLVSFEN